MTSATHHLPFLERVIDQPVFQHVNKILPSRSTSCKIPSWPSLMAVTSSAPNRGIQAIGLIFFLSLCVPVRVLFWLPVTHTFQRYVKFVILRSDRMYSSNEAQSK